MTSALPSPLPSPPKLKKHNPDQTGTSMPRVPSYSKHLPGVSKPYISYTNSAKHGIYRNPRITSSMHRCYLPFLIYRTPNPSTQAYPSPFSTPLSYRILDPGIGIGISTAFGSGTSRRVLYLWCYHAYTARRSLRKVMIAVEWICSDCRCCEQD